MAGSSASWPVVGLVAGLMPAPFMAAMAPPPVPSLAARTPTKPSLPSFVIAWSIWVWALSGLQSGVSYSAPMMNLPSRTLWAPFLNSVALLSVGEPLIITIVLPALPPAVSVSSSDCPCSCADLLVVERDVVVDRSVENQPVVADDGYLRRRRLLDDRRRGGRVDRVEHEHFAPLVRAASAWDCCSAASWLALL